MNDFFPEPPAPDPVTFEEPPQPVWLNPPDDELPGVVPVELVLGRSERAVVMLTGLRAFSSGVGMTLHVRTRARIRGFDLHEEVFDGPYHHDRDADWQRGRLKWGFEYADGRRATNLAAWPDTPEGAPGHPVLMGAGGGGGRQDVNRDYWLWPLPPAGPLTVVCQWLQLDIEQTTSRLDGDLVVAAASRAQPVWPGS